MPPATAKLALDPDAGTTPPPVTKSPFPEQFPPPHVMSAWADETVTSATLGTTTCRALTVIEFAEELCSLITTLPPPGRATVWFGEPETLTDCPLIVKPRISEYPET